MMDMFTDDISALVKETFDGVYNQNKAIKDKLPESAGVIYYVQEKQSVFVIRAIESRDIANEFDRLISDPVILKKLRLSDQDNPKECLSFFECDDFFMARAIVENFANKRYPLHEEHVFNVSDPGDCWWLKLSENSMSLYFKLCRTEIIDDLIKLGPIGDSQLTQELLKKLYGYFNLIFEIKDYSAQSGAFHLEPKTPNDPLYLSFINIFKEGEVDYNLMDHLRRLEDKSTKDSYKSSIRRANYFIMEIAHMRGFWKDIQKELN